MHRTQYTRKTDLTRLYLIILVAVSSTIECNAADDGQLDEYIIKIKSRREFYSISGKNNNVTADSYSTGTLILCVPGLKQKDKNDRKVVIVSADGAKKQLADFTYSFGDVLPKSKQTYLEMNDGFKEYDFPVYYLRYLKGARQHEVSMETCSDNGLRFMTRTDDTYHIMTYTLTDIVTEEPVAEANSFIIPVNSKSFMRYQLKEKIECVWPDNEPWWTSYRMYKGNITIPILECERTEG